MTAAKVAVIADCKFEIADLRKILQACFVIFALHILL